MKAFIFCASFFFFAAANASPFDNFGYGSSKRSDDQAVNPEPAPLSTNDDFHDTMNPETFKEEIQPPKFRENLLNFLRKLNVDVMVVHPEPAAEERWWMVV